MAKNPTFNLKTGADSDLIVAREVTDSKSPDLGKIKRNDGIFHFPYLTRRTGDSLTGTTENIESNELRHGRTRSAPRKGTSSSSGDINWEFSAETFDDMIESVFRGKWTRWTKDPECSTTGYFKTKCGKTTGSKKLIYDSTGTGDDEGLVHVKDNNKDAFVVHELKCGTEDIKYSLMKKYGGVTGEDLWQEFCHCALNTMQLSVEINSIITGSFGIMGTNNPKLMNTGEAAIELQSRVQGATEYEDLLWKGQFSSTSTYAENDVVEHDGKYYVCTTAVTTAADWNSANWTELDSDEYIENIPDKATDTIQFTAREGFLYINGEQIEFAQSLSFNLDNGLTQKFAIFVPNAISTTPLTLDITGDLSTYLVGGDSQAKKLFNDAVGDETVELVFCIQDKLDDPTALYLFQIFNAKHTENTINGNGEDTFDESLPWSSFGEQACRILRIIIPRFTNALIYNSDASGTKVNAIALLPSVAVTAADVGVYNQSTNPNGVKFTVKVDGSTVADPNLDFVKIDDSGDTDGYAIYSFDDIEQGITDKVVEITAEWRGNSITQSVVVPHS